MLTYYRRNLYILSFTIFLAAVSWNQIVPFLPLYLQELGVTRNLAQWSGFIFAIQSTAGIVMQPYWGSLGDKYGRKTMVIRAGICLGLIYLGMGSCAVPWQLALLRFLNGALTGFIPGSMTLIATNTPAEYSARYVAIAQTASAAGGILGPAIGGLLAGFLGFRGSMRVSGIIVLLATLVVWITVEERNKATVKKKTNIIEDFRIAFTNPIMAAIMVVMVFSTGLPTAIQPILTLYIENLSKAGPHWLSGLVFSLPGLAFLLTGYRWNSLGERTSYRRTILIGLVGSGLGAMLLSLIGTTFQFAAIYFVMGIFLAALTPSCSALIATRIEESFRGRAYAIQNSAGTFGGLIAPILAGGIGGYLGLRWVFAIVGLMVAGSSVAIRRMTRRWVDGVPEGEVTATRRTDAPE